MRVLVGVVVHARTGVSATDFDMEISFDDGAEIAAMIDWTSFDWPTFGTLVGAVVTLIIGICAVIGAWRVGNRQATISAQQVEISHQLVELERRKIDMELYERRFTAFDAVSRFVVTLATSELVSHNSQEERNFLKALMESKFLFDPSVYQELKTVWKKAGILITIRAIKHGQHRSSESSHESDLLSEVDLIEWMNERLDAMDQIFYQLKVGGGMKIQESLV